MALALPIPARSFRQQPEVSLTSAEEEREEVNLAAWQEVGRRIAGAFSRAIAEDDSEDEWMPLAQQEQEVVAAPQEDKDDAAWRDLGLRLAGAFSAAIASGDCESDDDDWEVPLAGAAGALNFAAHQTVFDCSMGAAASKGALPASPSAAAAAAQATPATLPSTAPGTAVPSETEPSDAEVETNSDSDGEVPSTVRSPAFSALFSLRLEDIAALRHEQRSSSSDHGASAEDEIVGRAVDAEDVAFRGLCSRIARVFEDASDSEEE